MARIFCVTSGLTGIVNASIELIRRLKVAGHEVMSAAPRDRSKTYALMGIPFVRLPWIQFDIEKEIPSFSGPANKVKRFSYKYSHRKALRQKADTMHYPTRFLEELAAFKPDLVLLDIELHEYIFAAYAQDCPIILLSQWFATWPQEDMPSLLTDKIPGDGLTGSRAALKADLQKLQWSRNFSFWKKRIFSVGTNRRSTLLRLAHQLGFPGAFIKENYWPGPFSYKSVPVLSMTAREMEFRYQKRDHLHYVGPMVDLSRANQPIEPKLDQKLRDIWELKAKNQIMLIYCSVSTMSASDQQFMTNVVTAVKDIPDWMLLVSLGGQTKEYMIDTPPNVHVFDYLPQMAVLQNADLSINHGGIHTINECIESGVPMLVYSGKKSDQNGCAARVHHHQLGQMADKDVDTPEQIKSKIAFTMTEPIYQKNVKAMQSHFKEYRTGRVLETFIESQIKEGHEA